MRPPARAKGVAHDEHPATRTPARTLPSAAALSGRERTHRAPGAGGEKRDFICRVPRRTACAGDWLEGPEASPDANLNGAFSVPEDPGELRLQVPAFDRSQADPGTGDRPLHGGQRQLVIARSARCREKP